MKNFFILLLLVISGFTYGQSSLEFNQVILLTATTNQAVPAGKVWKLVQHMPYVDGASAVALKNQTSTGCNNGYSHQSCTFYVNNYTYNSCTAINGASSTYGVGECEFPIWLPAGIQVRTSCPNSPLSIIEFNVTP